MRNSASRLLLMFLLWTAGTAQAQSLASAYTPLFPLAEDERVAEELRATGERRQGQWVVLFTPMGAVDDMEEAALVERLDKGLAALHAVVGRHDWQVLRTPIITFYVTAERIAPHTHGRGVFIPLARLHEGRAPFLHEAAHDVVRSIAPGGRMATPFPFWLTEGVANYVAFTAAERAGLAEHAGGPDVLCLLDIVHQVSCRACRIACGHRVDAASVHEA